VPRAVADWPVDAVELGHIGEAWGLKGWFRVQPFAADPQALLAARRWHLQPAGPRGHVGSESPVRAGTLPGCPALPAALQIAQIREQGESLVARAQGIDDRSAAEALRGARIFVARADFPPPAADEYYWADLIGLSVVNRSGLRLGFVSGLIDTGPQSVLRVQPDAADGAEHLIPFVAAYVDRVSLEERCITVDWEADY
jgi:16S rRNA processing protein RimM